jgi:isoleucyl-tRNA synthetase
MSKFNKKYYNTQSAKGSGGKHGRIGSRAAARTEGGKLQQTFKPVDSRLNYSEMNDRIIKFWKDEKIFEKSLDKNDKKNAYIFYDGPPFVTGLPHYGTLLSSIPKDLIPRYQTMKGKYVRRVWGWDCHGLPIENNVEEKLGLKSRRDIEKIGLQKFIEGCRSYVSQTSSEWNWYVDHVGRWVDMDNAYKTMDLPYMESVMWVFKTIYDKGLIYKGKRVSLYCPRCGTPVSNFEIAMDNSYKEITEPANTYKYKLTNDSVSKLLNQVISSESEKSSSAKQNATDNLFILAWSTTPWNKLATPALAVNPKLTYVIVKQNKQFYILAKTTLSILTPDPYEIVAEFSGQNLVDLNFEPHFDFCDFPKDKKAWVIISGDFVTAEEGTGVVTLAVYGEDDFAAMKKHNIVMIEHVDAEGKLTIKKEPWKGLYYLKANPLVNEDLTKRGLMYKEDKLTHTVPECWRCHTRLMFAPQDAWFMKVSQLKEKLLKTNEDIYWFPHHIKHGRFQKGIESAPDWCISRSRYWATPMPIWECKKCNKRKVIGSIKELEELTNKKVTDLHRPYIDEFTFPCQCGETMKRVEDVLDCWMESGSMPYAQRHYPFEKQDEFDASFPGDFVNEYIAQTRAWFYVMHVISNAIFDSAPFKNVICTGTIKGTDGRKMSKSYGNYPDPKRVIGQYGGDALRLYLMSSPVMNGDNLNIDEEGIKEQNQRVFSILWNSYKYFVTYANLYNYKGHSGANAIESHPNSTHLLDQWILTRLKQFTFNTTKYFDAYDIPHATRLIRDFVTDLSTWYIRGSRDRFSSGDQNALTTMHYVLLEFCKVAAPTIPFITDEIYQNLKSDNDPQSVHLCNWPQVQELNGNEKKLLAQMAQVRQICTLGNAIRKKKNIPTRQPLAKIDIVSPSPPDLHVSVGDKFKLSDIVNDNYIQVIKTELNVKKVDWQIKKDSQTSLSYDENITQELKDEGEARRIIRKIQQARQKAGTARDEKINITLPSWPKAFEPEIKQKAKVSEIKKGDKIEISEKVNVEING